MDIDIALQKAGSVSALARILNVTRQAVQQFRRVGLPEKQVEKLKQLRPEWFIARD